MPSVKLTKLQKDILEFFGRDKFGRNFYWTGGTLLAYLYLSHRRSVDLDFFSNDLYSNEEHLSFINRLKKRVAAGKVNLTIQNNRRMHLIQRDAEAVKLELVYFPFPAIEKRKRLAEFSVKTDSLTDIMVNKILSAYQRNESKDVFDLYIYLNDKPKYNLMKLAKMVEKKFGVGIEPALLIAKIYELADQLDILSPLLIKPRKNLKKEVKFFFQNIFNIIAKKQIK